MLARQCESGLCDGLRAEFKRQKQLFRVMVKAMRVPGAIWSEARPALQDQAAPTGTGNRAAARLARRSAMAA